MEVIVTFQERYCLPMYSRESLQEVFREVGGGGGSGTDAVP